MNLLSSIQKCSLTKASNTISYYFWFKFDGNNTNSGTTGTGALSGSNCVITSTKYKLGTAALYNNASSNSRFALSSITNTKGFSFALWMYLTNTQSGQIFCFVQGSNKNNRVFLYYDGSTIAVSGNGTGYSPSLNQWVHLAFTVNTSGSTEFYVNGAKYGNTLSTLYTNATLNYCMILGDWYGSYYRSVYAYVDDFRYVDGVLTAAQIASIYTEAIVPTIGTVSGNDATKSSAALYYYAFTTSTSAGTSTGSLSFTAPEGTSTVYVLAVGGGGGSNNDGGGGGGGVVQSSFTYSAFETETITVSVGNGGASSNSEGTNGYNTTVSFSSKTANNITAYGGGKGGKYNDNGADGGSGGGAGRNTKVGGSAIYSAANNAGYAGGTSISNNAGGGGGAGAVGSNAAAGIGGKGGDGVKPTLNKISTYFDYYFGGGGGGNCTTGIAGSGGKGGGGGANCSSGTAGVGDTNGINFANNGIVSTAPDASLTAGSGGANTGGGAGGLNISGTSKNTGGSGIVIIAFA
jgi:hypothetical protein